MRILDLIDLNRGETLKQGDSTLLRFQIADRDQMLPDRAGEQARVVFMFNNSIIHEELTVVQTGNIVEFHISEILPPNTYNLEIHVGGQIFPSDEFVFKITRSALNAEHNIIKLYGVDNIVDRAVDEVSGKFVDLTKEKLGLGNVINIKQASEAEVSQARGGYPTLDSRLDASDDNQRQTTAELAETKESLGEVNQDLQSTKDTINNIIVTPADGITEQEIIDARKGEISLGSKVEKIDTNIERQSKSVFDQYYRFGNEYTDKPSGGWIQGYRSSATTGEIIYNVDHVNINFTNTGGTGCLGVTTNNQIDLTNIDTLYIDWEMVSGGNTPRMVFGIHKDIGAPYSVFTEKTTVYDVSPRKTSKIDVSKYIGKYRIHAQAYTSANSSNIDVKIYNIYADTKLANIFDLQSIDKKFEKTNGYFGQQVYLDTTGSIYTESSNGRFYFKLLTGSLLFRVGNYSNGFDNNYMIASVPSKNVTTSPSGVKDVIELSYNEILVLDLENTSNRLTVIKREDFNYLIHYPLIIAIEGVVTGGQLHNMIQDKQIKELKIGSVNDNQQALDNVMYKATNENDNDAFRMLFITDTHAEGRAFENGKKFLSNVKNLETFGLSDLVIHGGDIINGSLASKQTALQNLLRLTKLMNSTTPTAFLAGNHDDNSYYNVSAVTEDFKITKEEWDKFIVSQFRDDFVFNENQPFSKYFYKDFERKKIRIICVDGVDMPDVKKTDGTYKWHGSNGWGYGTEQLNWLGNTALQLPSDDWHVVLVGHMDNEREGNLPYNADVLDNIIKTFNERTTYATTVTGLSEWNGNIDVDLTATHGVIVGYFYGHVHADRMTVNAISGITQVSTTKAQGDTNGAFDVITVNKNERTVRLTRYADGVDREFTY